MYTLKKWKYKKVTVFTMLMTVKTVINIKNVISRQSSRISCVVTQAQRGVSQPWEQGHSPRPSLLSDGRSESLTHGTQKNHSSTGERRAWDVQKGYIWTERLLATFTTRRLREACVIWARIGAVAAVAAAGSGSAALRWLTDGLSAGRAAVEPSSLFTVNDTHTTNCSDKTQVSVYLLFNGRLIACVFGCCGVRLGWGPLLDLHKHI